MWQSLAHLDENNNQALRDAINNKTPTKISTEAVPQASEPKTRTSKKTKPEKKEATTVKKTPKKTDKKTKTSSGAVEASEKPVIRKPFADLFAKKTKPITDQV